MTKREYLDALLNLCTERQKAFFKRMYPEGVNIKHLARAIQQVEATLRDTDSKAEKAKTQKKELEEENAELQKQLNSSVAQISGLERELRQSEKQIERLQGPSVDENAETLRRLELLDALEAGGVDNWDGYDFALNDMRG